MAQVDRASVAIGQPAVVEDLEEEVPDLRMRLLELVEEEDGEGLLADLGDQRRGLLLGVFASPRRRSRLSGVWYSLMSSRTSRSSRAKDERAEGLGDLRLAGPGRADEEEDAERARRISEAGLHERDPVDEALDRLRLPEDASVEVGANPLEAQRRPWDRGRGAVGRWPR